MNVSFFLYITLPSLCYAVLNLCTAGPVSMDVSTTAQEITCNNVTVLEGHSSEVSRICGAELLFPYHRLWNILYSLTVSFERFCIQVFACAWSPASSLLASGWVFII
jgi:hypothetical protein